MKHFDSHTIDRAVGEFQRDMERHAVAGYTQLGRGVLIFVIGPQKQIDALYIPADSWNADPPPAYADDTAIRDTLPIYDPDRTFLAIIVVADSAGILATAQSRIIRRSITPSA